MAKKVLLVEDEELIQNLLQRRLGDEGLEVLSAKDGQEGLQIMRQARPDVVLLDIIMPKKNGFQVLEEMQKDENLRNIPVIIISLVFSSTICLPLIEVFPCTQAFALANSIMDPFIDYLLAPILS